MLIILITTVQAYFEQKLTRHEYPYKTISVNEVVTLIQPNPCPQDLLEYTHNDTYVSQICFDKNVYYNIEVILGDNITNSSLFNMALDLSSPWTWYKSKLCKSCKKMNTLTFEIDEECSLSKKKSCFEDNFKQSYNATKWNDKNVKGQIYSEDSLLQGTFQTDTIQLLGFNSSQKMTISQFIAYEWGNQTPPSLAKVTGLQMLQVDIINKDLPILADGVLGFGFGYTETDKDKARSDTDFVEKLVKENTNLNLTRQQFALYTYNSSSNNFSMVAQVGGFDYKYAHKKEKEVKWIPRVENSSYYWMLQIDSVQYINQQGNDLIKYTLPINRAIVTLNSQFIELPYKLLIHFITQLESLHSEIKCELVDKDMYVLYCKNLLFDDLASYKFVFNFGDKHVVIDNWNLMLRKCDAANESQNKQNCLFQVKVSTSDYVILGEPFMRNHYVIFENQPGNNVRQIGILPAALHEYYPDNPDQYEWPLFKAILFIFFFGLISICSVTFLKSFCKDVFRAFKYRKAPNPEDQQSLRIPKDIDYVDYSTQEEIQSQMQNIQMTDQKKLEDWNKQQQQFNFGQQFANSIEQNSL